MSRRWIRLLFPLFALGLSLGLVELGLRVGGIAYPALDRPTYGLREWGVPHAEGWATGETRQWVRLNAEGARDRDHAVAKPPDTLRIVVVGDSYTSAFHVPLEATFWSVAERRLADCDARRGREIELIALETTALRLLESAAVENGKIAPFSAETDIFITPGYEFRVIDALVTNFHLPKSTLFMLVCALAGIETMQKAYAHAIGSGYRFYSYGDASLIERGRHMA